MQNSDFFGVVLDHSKMAEALERLTATVTVMVNVRHEYPMWPYHDDPLDAFEVSYHGPCRHAHYLATIALIRTLRVLRTFV